MEINTQQRRDLIVISGSLYKKVDEHSLMDSIRNIEYLDSKRNGVNIMDIDGSIWNYKNGKFFLIECKNNRAECYFAQTSHLNNLSASLCSNPKFRGIFLIQHKKLGIDDGSWISVLNNNNWNIIKDKNDLPKNFDKEQIFRVMEYLLN